ncbi:hypothetical protein NC651_012786 [Populus alba x Populus x berolinensis]|nr:hypothetical protein NC651_012786 [Populus alba x Populus x berolinensis]
MKSNLTKRRIWRMEYEGLHLVFFKCGQYGHRSEVCSDVLEDVHVD